MRLWGVIKSYNKRALKLLNATTLKKALFSLKINHKIPIPTI
ncbi:hypothetical protein HPHPA26_0052 [Helicobacter pylori Hp A-26]|uniref:Uncharacterized protein n=1 Tax=Helicobacter pylori Hp A-26 TaxID=992056 RepID=I9U6Q6_HELPX|nr:hypothetical protein HPHPA26_0052 [Helicobacter pylori Hp A-26]